MPDIHWGYGFCIGGVCAPTRTRAASSRPAASATTSTAASGWCRTNLFLPRRQARTSASWSRSCSTPSRPASARSGEYKFDDKEMQPLHGRGAELRHRPRPRRAARPRLHRGQRPHRRRPTRTTCQRPRRQARQRAVRHARLRQPLPGSAGRRSRLRRGRRRRRSAWRRTWSA